MCHEIEKETEIPIHCQRVIHNGRSLNNSAEGKIIIPFPIPFSQLSSLKQLNK